MSTVKINIHCPVMKDHVSHILICTFDKTLKVNWFNWYINSVFKLASFAYLIVKSGATLHCIAKRVSPFLLNHYQRMCLSCFILFGDCGIYGRPNYQLKLKPDTSLKNPLAAIELRHNLPLNPLLSHSLA